MTLCLLYTEMCTKAHYFKIVSFRKVNFRVICLTIHIHKKREVDSSYHKDIISTTNREMSSWWGQLVIISAVIGAGCKDNSSKYK